MDNLTSRQQEIYNFIASEIQTAGIPPTVREIAGHFDIFPKAVQDHLAALEKKGVLHRAKDRARGLIMEARGALQKIRIPILGRVPAGQPLEAIADVEDYLAVDEAIAKSANFALRVKGDSMFPEINDGDVVLVQSTSVAQNGEVVVATVDDNEATVKRLRRAGGDVYLQPANPAYPIIRGKDITIVGRVTSLIRTFF
jgi:repressor LexA